VVLEANVNINNEFCAYSTPSINFLIPQFTLLRYCATGISTHRWFCVSEVETL